MVSVVWKIVLAVTLVGLSAAPGFGWQIMGGERIFPEKAPMYTGFPDAPPNRGYFLNYSHALPRDYVYRSWWVAPRPGDSWSGGWAQLPGGGRDQADERRGGGDAGEELRQRVREIVRQLVVNSEDDIADGPYVTVSTFVSLNHLYSTSSLGRYLGEQMISELQLAGVRVVEIRKTPTILIREKHGEYGLSRDMDELEFAHAAQLMVAGTYTVANGRIFVNVRLLRNSDSAVLSSASMVFGIDRLVAEFLNDEGFQVTMPEKVVKVRAFEE